jgi:hypothetical protein
MKTLTLLFAALAFAAMPVAAAETKPKPDHKDTKECKACCEKPSECDACCHDKGKGVECKKCCSAEKK